MNEKPDWGVSGSDALAVMLAAPAAAMAVAVVVSVVMALIDLMLG